ncbi:MAG TPA: T9SS type A sorting domain-containing protein [Rubricoccaceae bacterium]|nr:T9SS type A sorting domain-containing protein [Rubricoccaceae bacterium]
MPRLFFLAVLITLAAPVRAQLPFTVEIEELTRAQAPALHSGAYAQHGGRWLFVAGRTNGLHGLQPNPEPFPNEFAHGAVVVYDPALDQRWTASLDALPAAVADPLRTMNGEHWQEGTTLYWIGGYGHSTAAGDKRTFPMLTAIDVPGIMAAVQNGTSLAPHIRQLTDERLAVAGGHLLKLGARYHLVGGNRFDGQYLGPTQNQVYTEAIRSFEIVDDGTTLALANFSEVTDAENLHRRDLNVGPVILPSGAEAFALYGGVFTAANHPYRRPVYVDNGTPTVDATFQAQFGHYTCPLLPMYDEQEHTMHTVFFGGMGQFYVNNQTGAIQQDNLVPFIDDVAALSRTEAGVSSETVLPFRMPAFLGSNAQFFLAPGLPQFGNGVLKLSEMSGRLLVGHIHGGIYSTTTHPGWMPSTGSTSASSRVFAVYVTSFVPPANEGDVPDGFEMLAAAPNPFRDEARLTVRLDRPQTLAVEVFDLLGRRVERLHHGALAAGPHTFAFRAAAHPAGMYVVRVAGETGQATQRLALVR